jgi:hypothetical protein
VELVVLAAWIESRATVAPVRILEDVVDLAKPVRRKDGP